MAHELLDWTPCESCGQVWVMCEKIDKPCCDDCSHQPGT